MVTCIIIADVAWRVLGVRVMSTKGRNKTTANP